MFLKCFRKTNAGIETIVSASAVSIRLADVVTYQGHVVQTGCHVKSGRLVIRAEILFLFRRLKRLSWTLMADWKLAVSGKPVFKIDPLR